MKILEAAFIFPFLLFCFVTVTLFSFDLHDRIVYEAAHYRYLTYDYSKNLSDSDYVSDESELESYIKRFSLLGESSNYTSNATFNHGGRCDYIRKYSTLFSTWRNL